VKTGFPTKKKALRLIDADSTKNDINKKSLRFRSDKRCRKKRDKKAVPRRPPLSKGTTRQSFQQLFWLGFILLTRLPEEKIPSDINGLSSTLQQRDCCGFTPHSLLNASAY